jgi:hypothetical protein
MNAQVIALFYSHLSFAFASVTVCHCMFDASSAPPRFSGLMWSITHPGHAPLERPVDGHGCDFLKSRLARALRRLVRWWLWWTLPPPANASVGPSSKTDNIA